MNYLLASHVWRQDHNGFTHQDPGFVDLVVNKKAEVVRAYFPPDANCLLSVMDHCLRSRHYVNLVIAGKHPAPQWLTMDAAVKHCTAGIGVWQWASNMTVLNDMDRFHLVMDVIDRVPQTGDRAIALKQQLKDKRIEHKRYIDQYGQDMPEIRDWHWDRVASKRGRP